MDLKKAARLQERLAAKLILVWEGGEVVRIGGADFAADNSGGRIAAVVVVMSFPELRFLEAAEAVIKTPLPYIPGFLSFREGPAFIKAFRRLRLRPDVTLLDGNGIAHPRKMGLASQVGVLLDIPTVGCAKSAFFPFRAPPSWKGAATVYRNDRREKVGFCLRTRPGVKPVFVSPGHRVDFIQARRVVLACSRFRIPEPLRVAHRMAGHVFSGVRRPSGRLDLQKAGE